MRESSRGVEKQAGRYLPHILSSNPMADSLRDQLQSTLGSAYQLERELGGGGMSRVFVATRPRSAGESSSRCFRRSSPTASASSDSSARSRWRRGFSIRTSCRCYAAGEIGRPAVLHDAVRRRRLAARAARGDGALPVSGSDRRDARRRARRSPTRTSAASCIATSSRTTCCSPAARRSSPTSASPRRSRRRRRPRRAGHSRRSARRSARRRTWRPSRQRPIPTPTIAPTSTPSVCMAYEMLAGQPPFHGRTPQKLLAAQMGEAAGANRDLRADLPPRWRELVMRCLEKEPDRPPAQSAMTS